MNKRKKKADEVELLPDAWRRFERAVDAAVKSGPKHRTKQKDQPVEIVIPEGVVIEISALSAAALQASGPLLVWGRAREMRRRKGSQSVSCRDQKSIYSLLGRTG